jgi:hypothetical protein
MNPRKRAHTTLAASKRAVFHDNACSNLFIFKSARPDVSRVYSRVRAHTRHTHACVRASVLVSAHTPTEVWGLCGDIFLQLWPTRVRASVGVEGRHGGHRRCGAE